MRPSYANAVRVAACLMLMVGGLISSSRADDRRAVALPAPILAAARDSGAPAGAAPTGATPTTRRLGVPAEPGDPYAPPVGTPGSRDLTGLLSERILVEEKGLPAGDPAASKGASRTGPTTAAAAAAAAAPVGAAPRG